MVLVCAAGALVSWLITRWITGAAHVREWVDSAADGRRMHAVPVPRLGGVAVGAGTAAALALALALGVVRLAEVQHGWRMISGVVAGYLLLIAVGVRDDLVGVRPRSKLAVQALAGVAAWAGGVTVHQISLPGGWSWSVGWLAPVLVVVWIVAATNAVNLIDGLDGLAGGLAIVGLLSVSVCASWLGYGGVAAVCVAMLGALAGFAVLNRHPASIFLGDSGSLTVGYLLAVLAITGATSREGVLLGAVAAGALAVPLTDTSISIVRRWLRGVPLFSGDARHVHHRLLAIGLGHRGAVRVLHAFAALVAALSLFLVFGAAGGGVRLATDFAALGAVVLLAYAVHRLDYSEFAVVAGAVPRLLGTFRGMVRDRVLARELAAALQGASSLAEIDRLLAECGPSFRLMDVRLRPHSGGESPAAAVPWACTLEFPVLGEGVLRICYLPRASYSGTAECLARVITPVLATRLASLGSAPIPPRAAEPFRVQAVAISQAGLLS